MMSGNLLEELHRDLAECLERLERAERALGRAAPITSTMAPLAVSADSMTAPWSDAIFGDVHSGGVRDD
jgi:hypothetical protein